MSRSLFPNTESTVIQRMTKEMAEAARLTRIGKLAEATALVQRLLQGGGAPGQAPSSSNTMAGAPPRPPFEFEGSLSATLRTGLAETLRGLAARAKAAGPALADTPPCGPLPIRSPRGPLL